MLIAKGRPATLTIEVRDFDGVLVAVSSGHVQVQIKDVDDATVVSGNATATAEVGVYTFDIQSGVHDHLGEYQANLTYHVGGHPVNRVVPIDVVGEYLFELHELRGRDPKLVNETAYPAEDLRRARETATQEIETAAMVAFATRRRRVTLSGKGTAELLLPDVKVTQIVSVTLYDEDTGADDDESITGDELLDIEVRPESGVLVRTDGAAFPYGSNNVVVEYDHGYEVPPAKIREAALTLALESVVPSGLNPRATSESTDLGSFRISVANEDLNRPTGIPSVDTAIQKYGFRRPSTGAWGR